ncbi:unnamed protein product [Effrenium voratum]|nr:unnamed protein product [Effrenium voratum]
MQQLEARLSAQKASVRETDCPWLRSLSARCGMRCAAHWLILAAASILAAMLLGNSMVASAGAGDAPQPDESAATLAPTRSPLTSAVVETTTTATTTATKSGACGHMQIDDWDREGRLKMVLLAVDIGGGRFGNQLFTAAKSLVSAAAKKQPVLLQRVRALRFSQILRLPCLRSSLGLDDRVQALCEGCRADTLWEDRSPSCNRGRGCHQLLVSKGMLADPGGGGFHQDLAGWGDSPSKFRSLLRQVFDAPMPEAAKDVALPGAEDLVIYFRPFKKAQIFDIHMKNVRLSSPPLDFFRFAVDSAQVRQKGAKIWVLTDPSLRQHPTVQRIQRELGAELFVAMDKVGKQCWLADWLWMKAAKRLAIAPSTFAWWAAFLGQASEVYLPIMPGEVPMPWCRLFPDDTRFLFHDLWKNTSYHEASAAKNICLEYFDCPQKQCPLQQRPEEVAALFPELLALRHPQDVEYLNASGGKRLPVPSAADGWISVAF